jgi:glucose/arabinose dehydrogenase
MKSLRTRTIAISVAGVLVCAAAATGSGAVAAATPRQAVSLATVPAGFTDTVVAAVPSPTALAAIPDGRKLVAQQTGKLRVIKQGVLLAAPAIDLAYKVCSNSERGLLGVAVDPHFTTNHFVYLYYTFKKYGTCGTLTAQVPVNRVSRFVMSGDSLLAFSERVLIDGIVNFGGNHNGGYVGFGHDGMLYVSVGDGGCDYTGVSGCAGDNATARRLNSLLGKVLRITPSGGIPTSNPYTAPGSARCNWGSVGIWTVCQEIYATGFRNPFRLAFDPNSTATRLFVNDVGQGSWEEIDQAAKGADYGWNIREGHCATGSTTDCGPPPSGLVNPIFDYGRTGGCGTITGGAFVPTAVSNAWGAKYAGTYLYADYLCNKIFLLARGFLGHWSSTTFATALGPAGPVALLFAPYGGKTSLFYTTYANGGEVHVIAKS